MWRVYVFGSASNKTLGGYRRKAWDKQTEKTLCDFVLISWKTKVGRLTAFALHDMLLNLKLIHLQISRQPLSDSLFIWPWNAWAYLICNSTRLGYWVVLEDTLHIAHKKKSHPKFFYIDFLCYRKPFTASFWFQNVLKRNQQSEQLL